MITKTYYFFIAYMSVWLEIYVALFGYNIPFTAMLIFSITISEGWQKGFFFSIVMSLFLDYYLGYTSFPVFLGVIFLARLWLKYGDCSDLFYQAIPSLFCVLSVLFMHLLFLTVFFQHMNFSFEIAKILFQSTVVSFLIMPVVIWVLDMSAVKLNLPSYRKQYKGSGNNYVS